MSVDTLFNQHLYFILQHLDECELIKYSTINKHFNKIIKDIISVRTKSLFNFENNYLNFDDVMIYCLKKGYVMTINNILKKYYDSETTLTNYKSSFLKRTREKISNMSIKSIRSDVIKYYKRDKTMNEGQKLVYFLLNQYVYPENTNGTSLKTINEALEFIINNNLYHSIKHKFDVFTILHNLPIRTVFTFMMKYKIGMTVDIPLHIMYSTSLEFIKKNPEYFDQFNNSCLSNACSSGDINLVKYIYLELLKTDDDDYNPEQCHHISYCYNPEILDYVISKLPKKVINSHLFKLNILRLCKNLCNGGDFVNEPLTIQLYTSRINYYLSKIKIPLVKSPNKNNDEDEDELNEYIYNCILMPGVELGNLSIVDKFKSYIDENGVKRLVYASLIYTQPLMASYLMEMKF